MTKPFKFKKYLSVIAVVFIALFIMYVSGFGILIYTSTSEENAYGLSTLNCHYFSGFVISKETYLQDPFKILGQPHCPRTIYI
jgi:hypothetical protein